MRRLKPHFRTRREGELSRTLTRSALVFLLAGALGSAYLVSRTQTLAHLMNADSAIPEGHPANTTGESPLQEASVDGTAPPSGPSRSSEILASQGVVLKQITVSGRVWTDPRDLLDAVGAGQGSPLMDIDPAEVRKRLLTLPWIASARVERRLPAEVHIDITEREPMALWQNNGAYMVIDHQGNVVNVDPGPWAHLPMVVGPGAAKRAADLLNLLTTQPAIAARVKAATLVGKRRWTLRLDNVESGLALRLPAKAPEDALATIARLDAQEGLLSKDLAMIDMRLPGRLVVRLVDRTGENTKTDKPSEGASAHRSGTAEHLPRGEGRDA